MLIQAVRAGFRFFKGPFLACDSSHEVFGSVQMLIHAINGAMARCIRSFIWGLGGNGESVNALLQQVVQGFIDHTMALYQRLAQKGPRDDRHMKMRFSLRVSPSMAGVAMGLVDDFQSFRLESAPQPLFHGASYGSQCHHLRS